MGTKIEITRKVEAPADLEEVREIAGELVGKECWGAQLGYGDELTLDIGGRVPRLPRTVPPKEKGEWVLRARATPWTIEPATGDAAPDEIAALLRLIEGVTIADVEVGYPDLSLEITFSNHSVLRLTPEPDEDGEDDLAHWEVFGPRHLVLEVGPGPAWTMSRDDTA